MQCDPWASLSVEHVTNIHSITDPGCMSFMRERCGERWDRVVDSGIVAVGRVQRFRVKPMS